MKIIKKWAYESPQAERIDMVFEGNMLATVYGSEDPVGGSEEGDTGDWGWGN